MNISDSLYFQFLNQRNMEYTLSHVYELKAENEENPIIKVIYQKLRDDSSRHLALIENSLKTLGKSLPKPIMIKITELDPSTMKKEEIYRQGRYCY